jgi:hypothetical protein
MEKKNEKCCICGKTIIGWCNNPWPLREDGKCCDECNQKVVAYRIIQMIRKERRTV